MGRFSSLWRNVRHKERVEAELEQEVQAHLDLLTEEKIQAGLGPEAARRAARVEIGGVEQVKERVREVRAGARLDELVQDLRYGLRSLGRDRGFTTVAVLALALGIGANTAIFSVVYGVLLRPLPYPEAERVAMVYMRFAPRDVERGTLSLADYLDWRAGNHAFEEPRAAARQREMAIRIGLGAGRGRLVRQLLTESLLLALAAGAAGLVLAHGSIGLLRSFNPGNLPRIQDVSLDGGVLAFAGVVSLLTGLLFGSLPALQTSRPNPGASLREGARGGSASRGHRRTHAALVVAEVALSLVLLVGAGLLLRSFVRLQQVETGLLAPPRRVVTLQISPNPARYQDDAAGIAFYERLLGRMRELPGVEAAALADSLPPDRQNDADTFVVEGQDAAQMNEVVTVPVVSTDYFLALGIPLRKGRFFAESDTAGSPPVAIISETLARRYFGGLDAVGRRIKQSGPNLTQLPYMEIVGVVGDAKYVGLETGPELAYYMPYRQSFSPRLNLVVRSAVDASSLGPSLAREVRSLDAEVVVTQVETLEQAISGSVNRPRFNMVLISAFAAIALLLAAIGLYGVIAYSVAQRRHEIGVRMALGARRADVLRLVMGQGAWLAAAGIVVGLAGSFALTRMLSSLLFSVSATDPMTFAGVSLLLAGVALLASLVPAARATRIDPLLALRVD